MNKFFTATVVTANLIALQTLSVARPVQAQIAQTLGSLEETGSFPENKVPFKQV